ncbi:MAG TPA: glycosyltransferase family 39 protein [Nitrososphaeraceae archaeon]|nr:glycosyltransferase family 39 protein [Nitrososphaeraceae archaeon]
MTWKLRNPFNSSKNSYQFLIFVSIILVSSFFHLWNLDEFPSIYRDEDHYLRKAMHILEGEGLQEDSNDLISNPSHKYDHPYFGQLFLGAVLKIIGYPDSLSPKVGDVHSIEMLYLVPRVIMGLLAVLDTFLIYKIGQIKYNRNVGLLSAAIFAVVPVTWILRRVWLEPIQLPFILSSILFAIYLNTESTKASLGKYLYHHKKIIISIFSGIFLGIAIFTKIPAFLFIPLVAFLIVSGNKQKLKYLALWSMPVILIPLIWPANALYLGEFNEWLNGLTWQSERSNENNEIFDAFQKVFLIDPIFLSISILSIGFAVWRKDFFILLGVIPFIIFCYLIGYVSYWHIIPIIPFLSMSISLMIFDITKRFLQAQYSTLFFVIFALSIIIPSSIISVTLINNGTDDFHLNVISGISQEIKNFNEKNNNDNNKLTILGTNYWLWIPKYILDNGKNIYKNYFIANENKKENILLVAGENFIKTMTRENRTKANVIELKEIYSKSDLISKFEKDTIKSAETNLNFDLDPLGSKKIELRKIYY